MFIVTTAADGELAGCLVGFTTQATIDPPRFLVALSREQPHLPRRAARPSCSPSTSSTPTTRTSRELFGGETGDEVDKFAQCSWRPGPDGVPLLEDCPRVVVGRILGRHMYGDHVGHLLEPIEVEAEGSQESLGFEDVKDLDPGHEA